MIPAPRRIVVDGETGQRIDGGAVGPGHAICGIRDVPNGIEFLVQPVNDASRFRRLVQLP